VHPRAARSTVANGWSTRGNGGPSSRTLPWNDVDVASASITAATSAKALTVSRASISDPARRTYPLAVSATIADDLEALRAVEQEIARLEIAREGLVQEASKRDEPQSGRRFAPDWSEPDRSDDLIQER
jgi:hypothetical protein